jgi:hypothetical protein
MGRIIDLVEELQGPANDLVDAAGRAGLLPRITSTVRSNSEQRRLYNRFLAGQAGYPVAPPGQSAHEYGLAFDMVVSPMEALADVGATWRSWGGGWNPSDAVHFELPGASEWARSQGGGGDPALQATSIGQDVVNLFIGLLPVVGEVQMTADLATLFPSLSKNDTLLILSNPTRFPSYIRALIASYK